MTPFDTLTRADETILVTTLDGYDRAVPVAAVEALRAAVRGPVCLPGDAGYDEARTLWNAMIDRHPAVVVRCRGAADVARAVDFCREHGLLLAVRGGGHNIAGRAVCEGGVLIDLSLMRSVHVDPAARRAVVEPGCLLSDVDCETQAHGLAVPTGINSTTGIAGLTLGGGFGWLTRKHGLTIDSLTAAEVVTADGAIRRASATENPDLFWALRGGGGNFGIVTAFEFALHDLGPQVTAGLVVFPMDRAREIMKTYRASIADGPDDLTVWAVLRKAPPLPFLPEEVHGTDVLILVVCHVGPLEDADAALAPVLALPGAIGTAVGPQSFADWQMAFDASAGPGARNYWKTHDFLTLPDAAMEAVFNYADRLPTGECEVFFGHVGGASSRVPVEATAFPQRRPHYVMNVHARWQDRADDARCIAWARGLFNATAPFAAGTAYVNFMPEDEGGRTDSAYGANMERLARIKAEVDPGNLFRVNQNIRPRATPMPAE
ncbi:putative oxidoreductase [Caenispirillum salinarum AK4]|uniref:Putative oxidoreductase n=1 Tax=Caenispirillum salinarum AK4 TaxID=1238182 RepID=K9GXI2_9PROT|nr:FAD-binding oxidoreductase [Caenispirillum salinarum]EKV29489.1 putative oxidoreductase [Caenispirillum salinarum AK4]